MSSSAKTSLPSCEDIFDAPPALTDLERQELIKGIASGGLSSLDGFIERFQSEDASVAERLRRARKRIEAQAARLKEKIESKYGENEQESSLLWKSAAQKYTEAEEALQKHKRLLEKSRIQELQEIIATDDVAKFVLEKTPARKIRKVSLLSRLGRAIKRFFLRIIGFFIKLFSRRNKKGKKEIAKRAKRPSLVVSYPGLGDALNDLGDNLGDALLTSPTLQEKVDTGLVERANIGKLKLAWQKEFDREEYLRQAEKLVKEDIREKLERKEEELGGKVLNVEKELDSLEESLKAEREKREKKSLERGKKLKDELDSVDGSVDSQTREDVRKEVLRELQEIGYIQQDGGELRITSRLVEKFADLVLADELKKVPVSGHATFGGRGVGVGTYERRRFQTIEEISRMDIVESVLNARIYHPKDRSIANDDIVIYREKTDVLSHVVLLFDKSGSMEENHRLDAAKRSALALYKAVKKRNPRNPVDLIAFDNTVSMVDLHGVWESTPWGFTNTSAALSAAESVLKHSKVDSKLVYLITDGLPEAYTGDDGEAKAGDYEKSLNRALSAAKSLTRFRNLRLTILLLEPEDETYVEAAKEIADVVGGAIVATDPQRLATELLVDYGV